MKSFTQKPGNKYLRKRIRQNPKISELHCIYAISILRDIFKYHIEVMNQPPFHLEKMFPLTQQFAEKEILINSDNSQTEKFSIGQYWPQFSPKFSFLPWIFVDKTNHPNINITEPWEEEEYLSYDSWGKRKTSFLDLNVERDLSWFKETVRNSYYYLYKEGFAEVRNEFQIALGLVVTDKLFSAKARAYLIKTLTTIIIHEFNTPLEKIATKKGYFKLRSIFTMVEVKEEIMALIRDLKTHLRQFPYSLEALNLLKIAYESINNHVELSKTIQTYNQVESLVKAGLIPDEKNPKQVRKTQSISTIETNKKNTGIDFENQVKKLLEQMDFTATTTKTTSDGGIDIIAYNQKPMLKGKYIVQCKDWKNPVGEPVLRDLYGLVLAEGANKGILVTKGNFTQAAIKFSEGKPLELINGEEFNKIILTQTRKSR